MKKPMLPLLKGMIPCCLFFLQACQQPASHQVAAFGDTVVTVKAPVGPPDTTTLGGGWFLLPVLPSDTASGRTPSIRFDIGKKHFSGNTGCNTMRGEFWYSDKDSSLTFNDKLMTTKMACPGYNEKAFIQSLLHTNHYRLKAGVLILMAEDNTELSRWTRQQVVPAKMNKA